MTSSADSRDQPTARLITTDDATQVPVPDITYTPHLVIITTSTSVSTIVSHVEEEGDQRFDRLSIIDAHPTTVETPSINRDWLTVLQSTVKDLADLGVTLTATLRSDPAPTYLYIPNLASFVEYTTVENVFKYIHLAIEYCKQNGVAVQAGITSTGVTAQEQVVLSTPFDDAP